MVWMVIMLVRLSLALCCFISVLKFSHEMLLISMLPASLNMLYLNILIYTNTTAFMFTYTQNGKLKTNNRLYKTEQN